MFRRIARGWELVKASWAVLGRHPKLLLLPVLSTLAFLTLSASILLSVFAGAQSVDDVVLLFESVKRDDPAVWAGFVAFYLSCTFIVIFFNAALVFCALECFAGRTPSLRGGLAMAVRRLPQILAWALVASTVGLLLSALQSFLRDKLGFLGALLGGVARFAWTVVTYFVVPLLVVDGVDPVTAVKRSSSILKKTWGEAAVGGGGLGIIAFLLVIPAILAAGLFATVGRSLGVDAIIAFGVIAIVIPYILAISLVFAALGTIFRTGVYLYATTGQPPSSMDPALLQGAFRKKK